jgi:hypothetical protein
MTPAPMPQWVLEQPERLAAQMDDILGLHDVSQGKAPRNIESGVGISVLVEQDSTPIGQIAREMAHGFERFGKLCLKLYEARVTETARRRSRRRGRTPRRRCAGPART